jgi:AAHS family 4-hydroxybenzoate transporter-like MFS transporter
MKHHRHFGREAMTGDPQIEISRLLDERGFGPFQIRMLIWTVILGMIDGYDIGAIAFAAPHLVRDWHLQPSDLKWVLTASNIGVLFGSQLMGFVGDRYGRKTALIASNLLFGVLTFAAAYSTDLTQMFWLRFFAGFGIGGVIPNIVAINAESAPRRLRATIAIIAVGFVPVGGALAGFASAALIPHYGWPVLFHIGGVVPVIAAVGAIIGLPESIKYMVLHASGRAKMTKLIAAIRPGFDVPANARFVIEDEQQAPSSNPVYLFRNGLWLITPLLWLLFALNLMGYFFLISWTPTLLAAAKLPQATAALAGAALQIGGTVGALVLCWWLQRHRFFAVAILFVLAVPVVASIGYAGMTSPTVLLAATFLGGFLVLGIQSGINVSGALVYPTSLRANGSGWELGIGRFGSIVGPLLGALFVGLSVEKLYVWSALPFAAGAIVCFAVHALNTARLDAHPELKQAQ